MRAPGVIGLLQLGAVLALAIPALLFGAEVLLGGRVVLGAAFLGLGVGLILLQWWLTNPLDPVDVAEAALDRLSGGREQ